MAAATARCAASSVNAVLPISPLATRIRAARPEAVRLVEEKSVTPSMPADSSASVNASTPTPIFSSQLVSLLARACPLTIFSATSVVASVLGENITLDTPSLFSTVAVTLLLNGDFSFNSTACRVICLTPWTVASV